MKTVLSRHWLIIVVLGLIFAAVAAYGGEYVWQEAWIVAGISLTGIIVSLQRGPYEPLRSVPANLRNPLLVLAGYSILQAVLTILLTDYFYVLPSSYDATASLWSGAKLLAFLLLVGLSSICLQLHRTGFVFGVIGIGGVFGLFGLVRSFLQASESGTRGQIFGSELQPTVGFGTFLNQNHFAMLMLMTIGLSIGLLVIARLTLPKKLALFAVGLTAWIALVLTASRGGIIGSFVVIVTLIIFWIRSTVIKHRDVDLDGKRSNLTAVAKALAATFIIVISLIAGVIFVGQERVVQRFASLPNQLEVSSGGPAFLRTDVWIATGKLIEEHPVFGVGFGGFRYAIPKTIDVSGNAVPREAHNDYLELLVSGGVIAAVLFGWFVYGFVSEVRRGFRESRETGVTAARVGAICGIVGVAFHSFTDFGLQYAGNISFLAALIAISVYRRPSMTDITRDRRSSASNSGYLSLSGPILILVLCALLGLSRYSVAHGAGFGSMIELPFDAEVYSARADRLAASGDIDTALVHLRKATSLRTQDYRLWIRLADLESIKGNGVEAENAYRSAVELAPLFGDPHFAYGAFLMRSGRNAEAVNELVYAAYRDEGYIEAALNLIWDKTTRIDEYLAVLYAHGRPQTRAKITDFILARKELLLLRLVTCRVDTNDMERDTLSRQLLELREYRTAWQIYRRQCDTEELATELLNGDFEQTGVKKGFGFGWIVDDSLKRSNVGLDPTDPASGSKSLRLTFDGEFGAVLLKQTIPVEQDRQYQVAFSYRSREIVSGSELVVEVIVHSSEASREAAVFEIPSESAEWRRAILRFHTDHDTQAVEILLRGRSCGDGLCPIFGKLWLDDFAINQSDS